MALAAGVVCFDFSSEKSQHQPNLGCRGCLRRDLLATGFVYSLSLPDTNTGQLFSAVLLFTAVPELFAVIDESSAFAGGEGHFLSEAGRCLWCDPNR